MPSLQLPDKLLPFLESPRRFNVLYGGRGSGKSFSVAALMLMAAQTKGAKIAAYREYMNSIDDSVHSLLTQQIEAMELTGFEVQNNQILFNGEPALNSGALPKTLSRSSQCPGSTCSG